MPKRLEQAFLGEGGSYKLIIYDTSENAYILEGFQLTDDGLIMEEVGSPQEVFDPIHTQLLTINMYINSPGTWSFLDDLVTFSEGRFFAEVTMGQGVTERVVFRGKLLVEDLRIKDEGDPVASIRCIDGLSDLKHVDFVFDAKPNYLLGHVYHIVYTCLKELPTYFLYDDTDIVAVYFSNILISGLKNTNPDEAEERVVSHAALRDYFYKQDGENTRAPLNCYEVLVEVCKRCYMQLRYKEGKYYFIGVETIHDGVDEAAFKVNKLGNIDESIFISPSTVDISNKIYSGGNYLLKPGYKSARYVIDEDNIESRKWENIGSYNLRVINYGFNTTSSLSFANHLEEGSDFKVKIFASLRDIHRYSYSSDEIVDVEFRVYETLIDGSGESDVFTLTKNYELQEGHYLESIDVPSVEYDRLLYLEVTITNPTVPTIDWLVNLFYDAELVLVDGEQEVYYSAFVTDSTSVLHKNIEIKATQDNYLTQLSKAYFADYSKGITTFKIGENAVAEKWEEMTLKRTIALLRQNVESYTVSFKGYIGNVIGNLLVNDDRLAQVKEYVVGRNAYDFRTNINRSSLIKVPPLDYTDVEYQESEPFKIDISNTPPGFSSGVESISTNKPLEQLDRDIETNEVDITVRSIPDAATYNSIAASVKVYVNGRLWDHVNNTVSMPRETIYVDKLTDKVIFSQALRGARVYLMIYDYFVIGETS